MTQDQDIGSYLTTETETEQRYDLEQTFHHWNVGDGEEEAVKM